MWPRIIQLLQSRGYSQAKLAAQVGVDQSTICRLGDGRSPEPRYSVAEALIELAGGRLALEQAGIELRPLAPPETNTEPASAGV